MPAMMMAKPIALWAPRTESSKPDPSAMMYAAPAIASPSAATMSTRCRLKSSAFLRDAHYKDGIKRARAFPALATHVGVCAPLYGHIKKHVWTEPTVLPGNVPCTGPVLAPSEHTRVIAGTLTRSSVVALSRRPHLGPAAERAPTPISAAAMGMRSRKAAAMRAAWTSTAFPTSVIPSDPASVRSADKSTPSYTCIAAEQSQLRGREVTP